METSLLTAINDLLALAALPKVGLSAIFVVSLVSATLLPLGSEPAVFGYVKLAPDMFWPAILIATAGNTVGGAISYWMGWGAWRALDRWKAHHPDHGDDPSAEGSQATDAAGHRPVNGTDSHAATGPGSLPPGSVDHRQRTGAPRGPVGGSWHERCSRWLVRLGPPALLLSWLPAIGDPLCAVAGWLRLSFWPCVFYMALGKFGRYLAMTLSLLWAFSD